MVGRCVWGTTGCCPSEGRSYACRTLIKIILHVIVFLVIVEQGASSMTYNTSE